MKINFGLLINQVRKYYKNKFQHPIIDAKTPSFDINNLNIEEIVEYMLWSSRQNKKK